MAIAEVRDILHGYYLIRQCFPLFIVILGSCRRGVRQRPFSMPSYRYIITTGEGRSD